MHWFNVTAVSTKDKLEAIEQWFWDHGAVSVTVEDATDSPIYEPPPGEQPVWQEVVVTGLFEDDSKPNEISDALQAQGYAVIDVSKVEDRDWEREWLSRFEPMQFGEQLWVCPSGFEKPNGTVIQLDPGLAFGTGTHETTRLCLEFLDGLDVSGWQVLDYGCGSGVLGIGAALKGADSVTAIDNDPQALTATEDNAQRNDVALSLSMPGKDLAAVDLVFANILAQPLTELAPILLNATKPNGLLILSGIMSSQKEWVASAYEQSATLIDDTELNGWVRLVWRR